MSVKSLVSAVALCVLSSAAVPNVYAFDILRTESTLPVNLTSDLPGADTSCEFGPLSAPLKLYDAVQRTLCNNPKTRQAWANVKVQAATLGVARSAFLPSVSATWQDVRDDSATNVTGHPDLSSGSKTSVHSDSVSLTWTLFDFGGRRAAVENARQLLEAARATEDAALQAVFANVAKDFYAAQAGKASLTAALDVEQTAQDSVNVATKRVRLGVAPISDQLQAETALAQAVVTRVKAENDLQDAIGSLDVDMGYRPGIDVSLPDVQEGVLPDSEFSASIGALLDEAEADHPAIRAAIAQVEAAQAKTRQVRAEGLPSLGFVAKYSNNNQPASLGLGIPQFPATGHDWYFGVQVTIPLFEGFGRSYQVREAEAQTLVQQADLADARLQVGLDVWTSFHGLEAATKNVTNSATLLDIAQRSFVAAQRRYQSGAGSILELLSAQTSLANAQKQRIQSLTDWRTTRLELASKLGKLQMWHVAAE